MEEGRWTAGLLFQQVARARRWALLDSLEAHGMEDLAQVAVPWLLDGAEEAPELWEGERLLRVCRVVDERMLDGFTADELALLTGLLRRVLRNLREEGALPG